MCGRRLRLLEPAEAPGQEAVPEERFQRDPRHTVLERDGRERDHMRDAPKAPVVEQRRPRLALRQRNRVARRAALGHERLEREEGVSVVAVVAVVIVLVALRVVVV